MNVCDEAPYILKRLASVFDIPSRVINEIDIDRLLRRMRYGQHVAIKTAVRASSSSSGAAAAVEPMLRYVAVAVDLSDESIVLGAAVGGIWQAGAVAKYVDLATRIQGAMLGKEVTEATQVLLGEWPGLLAPMSAEERDMWTLTSETEAEAQDDGAGSSAQGEGGDEERDSHSREMQAVMAAVLDSNQQQTERELGRARFALGELRQARIEDGRTLRELRKRQRDQDELIAERDREIRVLRRQLIATLRTLSERQFWLRGKARGKH